MNLSLLSGSSGHSPRGRRAQHFLSARGGLGGHKTRSPGPRLAEHTHGPQMRWPAGGRWMGPPGSRPRGGPLPWGPPFQVFLAQLWARAGQGFPQGERETIQAEARARGGPGRPEAQAELRVRTLVQPRREGRAPTVLIVLMSRGAVPTQRVKHRGSRGVRPLVLTSHSQEGTGLGSKPRGTDNEALPQREMENHNV